MDKNWSPDTIVLGPAGVKLFEELGALSYLEQIGVLKKIKWFIGVSAGAMISYFLILGYTIEESITIFMKYNVFNDILHFDYSEVWRKLGLLSNDGLRAILVEATVRKFSRVLTLKELYDKTKIRFTTVTFDITNQDVTKSSCVYMSSDTHPDFDAIEAVLCSANIPVLFQRQLIDGHCYVDGALGNPYPIDLCDDGTRDVLGIYVTGVAKQSISTSIVPYLEKVIDASINELRYNNLNNSTKRCGHVHLRGSTSDPLGVAVTRKDKRQMVIDGYQTMTSWWKSEVPSR